MGRVRPWERNGSDDARVGALRRGDRDRMWPHDLPGRLLPSYSFPRTLCCGPGCHDFESRHSPCSGAGRRGGQRRRRAGGACPRCPGWNERRWRWRRVDRDARARSVTLVRASTGRAFGRTGSDAPSGYPLWCPSDAQAPARRGRAGRPARTVTCRLRRGRGRCPGPESPADRDVLEALDINPLICGTSAAAALAILRRG